MCEETKKLIDELERYIEMGRTFKTYEMLKAVVRKLWYLQNENERLKGNYDNIVEDVKNNAVRDICEICKAYNSQPDCECDCMECKLDCPCRECRECSNWKWRGEE